MPLLKNPAFQPPKPVSLNTNYAKLIPNLPNSVVPPKLNITEADVESWGKEIEDFKKDHFDTEAEKAAVKKYQDWLKSVQRKVAPGFSNQIMTPTSAGNQKEKQDKDDKKSETGELKAEPDKSGINEDLRNLSMD